MHTRGRSRDMYQQASYHDVIGEVLDELRESLAFATACRHRAGIACWSIPGSGFAKEAPHSYEALARLDEFSELGRPILVGPSRKSFLAKAVGPHRPSRPSATGPHPPRSRRAVLAGAHIVRVHAVARDGSGCAGDRRDSEVSSR